jgi:hypothetical protein
MAEQIISISSSNTTKLSKALKFKFIRLFVFGYNLILHRLTYSSGTLTESHDEEELISLR